jgi:HlyD family secretion protein
MVKAKTGIAVLALVAAGVAGGLWWWAHRPIANAPLALEGNVEIRQVNLGFKVGGRIATLNVDEGTTVAAGQQLASLDKVYFEDAIAQLKAQQAQLKANLDKLEAGNRPEEIAQTEAAVADREATLTNAKIALDRAKTLLDTSTGTRKAYDDALAADRQATAQLNSARAALRLMKAGFRVEDIAAARAQLAGAEAALQIAERQLADAQLVAPSAGVILTRVQEVGAIVNPAETVVVLSLTSPVWVRTYVSEVDLGRVRPGQLVQLKIDTPGVPPMEGRIGFISATAEFTPKTVETRELRTALVYRIRIVVDDPKGVLRQGMPVSIIVMGPNGDDGAATKISERRS